jgi:type I restriction enzyme M protein
MTADHKKKPQSQLWNMANTLRGKMGADEFRDYVLGFQDKLSAQSTDGLD